MKSHKKQRMKGLKCNMLEQRGKSNRLQILRIVPGWLWRLVASVLLAWLAFVNFVPWVASQRGYATIGGEYLLVLVAFILPFCIFRSR